MWITAGYSVSLVLRIVGVSRSTYYFQQSHDFKPQPHTAGGGRPVTGYSFTKGETKVSDEQINEWIMTAIADNGLTYGNVKLAKLLRREQGLIVNKKKMYRMRKELYVLKPQRRLKMKYPRKLARNRAITEPNQLWEVDIMYGTPS